MTKPLVFDSLADVADFFFGHNTDRWQYATAQALADAIDIGVSTLHRWQAQGCPVGRGRPWDAAVAVRWALSPGNPWDSRRYSEAVLAHAQGRSAGE